MSLDKTGETRQTLYCMPAAGEWDPRLQGPLGLGASTWRHCVCVPLTNSSPVCASVCVGNLLMHSLQSWTDWLVGGALPLEIPKVSSSDWVRGLSRYGY